MALEIFDGIPGAGKTYSSMALRILPHLAKGGFVVTNVEVKPDGIGKWILHHYGRVWNPARLRKISDDDCVNFFRHLPKGSADCPVLVVLDEVHLWFNARDWSKNDAKARETFEMATQHRKFHLDIVMISQHLSNIDGQFLKLIAGLSRFRDLKKWHPPGLPFVRIPWFRFLALHFDKTGRQVIKRDWMRADKLVFDSYNTLAVLKGGEVMAGAEVMEREELEKDPRSVAKARKLRRIVIWVLAAAVIAVLARIFWPRETLDPVPVPESKSVTTVAPPKVVSLDPHPNEDPQKPFLSTPPKIEILKAFAVGGWSNRKVLAQLDGYNQWLQAGSYCTRGRVATVRPLNGGIDLHEVTLFDDENVRRIFRVVLVRTPSTNLPQSAAPSGLPAGINNALPDGAITVSN